MKIIIIESDVKDQFIFAEIFRNKLPQFTIQLAVDYNYLIDIEYVVIWRRYPKYLLQLPNLKAVLTCGSGVDHLIFQNDLLKNIPHIRIVDSYLKIHVADYVKRYISSHYHKLLNYASKSQFDQNQNIQIGIMGFGQIGKFLTLVLKEDGYKVRALTHRQSFCECVEIFNSQENYEEFFRDLNILICALPLTDKTRGILDFSLFEKLSPKCYLMNIGRAEHLIDEDLIMALKNNMLLGACIDVIKPNSSINLLSKKEKSQLNIVVTSHIAGYISAKTQAPEAQTKVLELENGIVPSTVISFNNQY